MIHKIEIEQDWIKTVAKTNETLLKNAKYLACANALFERMMCGIDGIVSSNVCVVCSSISMCTSISFFSLLRSGITMTKI